VLQAILEPAHGTAEAQREQRDEHILRVHDELGAEAAADVGGDDAHAVGRKIELARYPLRFSREGVASLAV